MSMQNPALKVRLRKGLAERNRLPLTTMLKILEECRLLVNEFARRHSAGKDIDLQLEIVGSPNGDAFQAGSLQACISAGAHPEIAALAMNEVIGQLVRIERNDISFVHGDAGAAEIVRRFYRIGLQQEKVSSELELSMLGSGEAGYSCGNLTAEGMKSVRSLQTPNAEVRGIQIYGKLMVLRDIMKATTMGVDLSASCQEMAGNSGEYVSGKTSKVSPGNCSGKASSFGERTPKEHTRRLGSFRPKRKFA